MDIKDFALTAGLDVVSSDKIVLDRCEFKYIKANRVIPNIPFQFISLFYMVELTKDNAAFISDFKRFRILQNTLLSDPFFEIKNDIRWNIYLVFIFDGRYSELDDIPAYEIETDEEFARKYIFNVEDGLKFFQRDRHFISSSEESPINPVKDWVNILTNIELTGILSETFFTKNVINYINGAPFNSKESFSFSDDEDVNNSSVKINNIEILQLGKFRDHCFGENDTLYPRQVNLLHGANGCGKTSILEGIEFALTNEIKRLKDYKENFQELPEVKVTVQTAKGTSMLLSSKKETTKCRELDKDWYGTPIGREKSTLNGNYNLFNSFNSETAHRFALDEINKETDYEDTLTKLLYDDSILAMDKLWNQKYKPEFKSQLNIIRTELEEKRLLKSKIETELQIQEAKEDYCSIRKALESVKYKTDSALNSFNQYHATMESLKALESTVSAFKSYWDGFNIVNVNDFDSYKKQTETEESKLHEELTEKQNKRTAIEEKIKELNSRISYCKTEKASNAVQISEFTHTIEEWIKHKNVILRTNLVTEYQALKEKENELQIRKAAIQSLRLKYSDICNLQAIDIDVDEQELDRLTTLIYDKNNQLLDIKQEFEKATMKVGQIKKLKVQLTNLGMEALKYSDEKSNCPLCGVKHQNETVLIAEINTHASFGQEDLFLQSLESRKNGLSQEIELYVGQQAVLRRRAQNEEAVNNLLSEVNKDGYFPQQNDMPKLAYVQSVLVSLDTIDKDLATIRQSIINLESDGIGHSTIHRANLFKTNNNIFKDYINKNGQINGFDTFLYEQVEKLNSNNAYFDTEIISLVGKVDPGKLELQGLNTSDIENRLSNLRTQLGEMLSVREKFTYLQKYFDIILSDDVRKWFTAYEDLLVVFDIEMLKLRAIDDLKKKQEQLKTLIEEIRVLIIKEKRCGEAVTVLESMKFLNEYAQEFIKSNIKRIEYFFKALHTPREFIELNNDRGGIYAIREKDSFTVRMYQMSTGQRVSLALAIMFSLHIAAKRAPSFLIMDEPVANLDDLHLFNLIDIIREFAVRGTQILFTTANPDVSGLFRRKFSFFGTNFVHFEFIRRNDDFTNIMTFTYEPDKERRIALLSVS